MEETCISGFVRANAVQAIDENGSFGSLGDSRLESKRHSLSMRNSSMNYPQRRQRCEMGRIIRVEKPFGARYPHVHPACCKYERHGEESPQAEVLMRANIAEQREECAVIPCPARTSRSWAQGLDRTFMQLRLLLMGSWIFQIKQVRSYRVADVGTCTGFRTGS